MSKFDEAFDKIMEETRRTHLTLKEVEKVFSDVMSSLGKSLPETWSAAASSDGRINLAKWDNSEIVKSQVGKAFRDAGGINKEFKNDLKEDGYEVLVKLADDLKLWRDYPPVS
jgi:hypothetical protein